MGKELVYIHKGIFNLMFGLTKVTAPHTSQHTQIKFKFTCHFFLSLATLNATFQSAFY